MIDTDKSMHFKEIHSMHARVLTSALAGLKAHEVEVEVRLRKGRPGCQIIGLADSAVKEASERVRVALKVSGFQWPKRLLINLAPAEIKKEGSGFDLPIAIAVLIATNQLPPERILSTRFIGELSLDGGVRGIRGAVAHALSAAQDGATTLVVPAENAAEADLVEGLDVVPVKSLLDVIGYLSHGIVPEHEYAQRKLMPSDLSFSDVRGQQAARRAAEIAVAGSHNLLMIGPPGCGKSMIAKRIPGILPELTKDEALEIAQIYSTQGLSVDRLLLGERPFRAPHHVVSEAGLCGGGGRELRAGEVSLAHHGLLFLDEFPEFRRSSLEALRTPIESGTIQITRARASQSFPAKFQLVAAMNPCPCGRLGAKSKRCECSAHDIKRYLKKLSQPILERIDLHVELDAVGVDQMRDKSVAREEPEELRQKCAKVRCAQLNRDGVLASQLELDRLIETSRTHPEALELLEKATQSSAFSARSFVRILRVAQTVADLEDSNCIQQEHVAEALRYRALDKLRAYAEGV